MTPKDFVACVVSEKEDLLEMCMNPESGCAAAVEIAALGMSTDQTVGLAKALNGILTDAYYNFLLALDGAASLGSQQRDYELRDEDGILLTKGKLEGPAWEQFHGPTPK